MTTKRLFLRRNVLRCIFAFLAGVAVTMTVVTMTTASEPAHVSPCEFAEDGDRVVITAAGEPFATYVPDSNGKPILFPICGPTGQPMTRSWPMDESVRGEAKDHPHQRSFWFTHGDVNGVSFWMEGDGAGRIVETSRATGKSADDGVTLTTTDEWVAPDGTIPLTDRRTFEFRRGNVGGTPVRMIDVTIELTAAMDEVRLGDTKEGSFGLRVWEEMRPDRKNLPEGERPGRIVNAEGLENDAAWGKRSDWVDYSGPAGGERAGITIMNHPESFRAPTWWHVRTYGLFAANPFGIGDFTGRPGRPGDHVMHRGESITLRYRVLFHDGTRTPEQLGSAFEAYCGH